MASKTDTCPLCGGKPTQYGTSWSDGEEWIPNPLHTQNCDSCGLPVKLWDEVRGKVKGGGDE
jgi:hypothetical protein